MTPDDISVVAIDGFIHAVTTKFDITIYRFEDPEANPASLQGLVSTRYTCGCGLTVYEVDAALDSDARWLQSGPPDCPNGC